MLTNVPTLVVAVAEDPEQALTPFSPKVYAWKGSRGLADSCPIVAPCPGGRRSARPTWLLPRLTDAQGSRHERGNAPTPVSSRNGSLASTRPSRASPRCFPLLRVETTVSRSHDDAARSAHT